MEIGSEEQMLRSKFRSINLIQNLRHLSTLNQNLSTVSFEIDVVTLKRQLWPFLDAETLQQVIEQMQRTNAHLQLIISQKDLLLSKIQSNLSKNQITLPPANHQDFIVTLQTMLETVAKANQRQTDLLSILSDLDGAINKDQSHRENGIQRLTGVLSSFLSVQETVRCMQTSFDKLLQSYSLS